MLESACGSAHCTALAMLNNFTYPADIFPSNRFYHHDLASPPLELVPGPEGTPGVQASSELAVPRDDLLQKQVLQQATIR